MPELSVHPAVSNLAAAMRSGGVKVGVGETITWARALLALGPDEPLDETLGVALKVREDIERVRAAGVLRGA